MTIQIAHLIYDYDTHPEAREAYLDLSGFLQVEFLKQVLKDPEGWAKKGISYRIVAEVENGEGRIEDRISDLEHAYHLTQTLQDYWWKNDGVKPLFDGEGCRSTSMGDLMYCYSRTYVVSSFGFEEVTR